MTGLIPTDQWVYDLYRVDYYDKEGGRKVATQYLAAAFEGHLNVWENGPSCAEWAEWTVVKENVPRPLVIGRLYRSSIYESEREHGERLAKKYNLL